jgi:hypothetical protein
MGQDLTPPILNISALFLPRYLYYPYGTHLSNYSRNASLPTWEFGNRTYDSNEMNQRGKCQAVLVCGNHPDLLFLLY